MPSITIDTSRLPVLVIRFDGAVDDAAFDRYLGESHELSAGRGQSDIYAMVIDSRNGGRPTPGQRHRQNEFIKNHQDDLANRCAGAAFVITSAVGRGVLTALLWVQPMPYEHVVVGTLDEAEAWCRKRLAAHGAAVKRSA